MSIKMNLEFMKESKEILDGIERLTRLVENLEIENIEIYQDIFKEDCIEDGKARAKVIYKSLDDRYNQNYFTCNIHKGTLEHYFDVNLGWSTGSIYGNVGDFGFTPDQVLYLKYGNQNLYIVEDDDIFQEVGTTFSETELRENFNENWKFEEYYDEDDFDGWLETIVKQGHFKKYILFDTNINEELDRLFGK